MVSAILKTLLAESIWTISQHCPTEISFSLCALLMCLFSQPSVKLVPTCAGLLGTQLDDAGFYHENEMIMTFK